ncbi:MAG: Cell filamentation protein Fic, partial [Acidobacteriota bacterium]|nr:Cell filamentation protein Fic [Acidobacteriota bacterium]
KELLTHSGNVSAEAAAQKAEEVFDKYSAERTKTMISDFDIAVKELEKKEKFIIQNSKQKSPQNSKS